MDERDVPQPETDRGGRAQQPPLHRSNSGAGLPLTRSGAERDIRRWPAPGRRHAPTAAESTTEAPSTARAGGSWFPGGRISIARPGRQAGGTPSPPASARGEVPTGQAGHRSLQRTRTGNSSMDDSQVDETGRSLADKVVRTLIKDRAVSPEGSSTRARTPRKRSPVQLGGRQRGSTVAWPIEDSTLDRARPHPVPIGSADQLSPSSIPHRVSAEVLAHGSSPGSVGEPRTPVGGVLRGSLMMQRTPEPASSSFAMGRRPSEYGAEAAQEYVSRSSVISPREPSFRTAPSADMDRTAPAVFSSVGVGRVGGEPPESAASALGVSRAHATQGVVKWRYDELGNSRAPPSFAVFPSVEVAVRDLAHAQPGRPVVVEIIGSAFPDVHERSKSFLNKDYAASWVALLPYGNVTPTSSGDGTRRESCSHEETPAALRGSLTRDGRVMVSTEPPSVVSPSAQWGQSQSDNAHGEKESFRAPATNESLSKATTASTADSLKERCQDGVEVSAEMRGDLIAAVTEQLRKELRGTVAASLREEMRAEVRAELQRELRGQELQDRGVELYEQACRRVNDEIAVGVAQALGDMLRQCGEAEAARELSACPDPAEHEVLGMDAQQAQAVKCLVNGSSPGSRAVLRAWRRVRQWKDRHGDASREALALVDEAQSLWEGSARAMESLSGEQRRAAAVLLGAEGWNRASVMARAFERSGRWMARCSRLVAVSTENVRQRIHAEDEVAFLKDAMEGEQSAWHRCRELSQAVQDAQQEINRLRGLYEPVARRSLRGHTPVAQ